MSKLLEQFISLNNPKFIHSVTKLKSGIEIESYNDSVYQNQFIIDKNISEKDLPVLFADEISKKDSVSIRYSDSVRDTVNFLIDNDYWLINQEYWLELEFDKFKEQKSISLSGIKNVHHGNFDQFRDSLEKFFQDVDAFSMYADKVKQAILTNEEGESFSIYISGEGRIESVLGFLYSQKQNIGQILFAYDIDENDKPAETHYDRIIHQLVVDSRSLGLDTVFTIGTGEVRDWKFLTDLGFRIKDVYLDLVK